MDFSAQSSHRWANIIRTSSEAEVDLLDTGPHSNTIFPTRPRAIEMYEHKYSVRTLSMETKDTHKQSVFARGITGCRKVDRTQVNKMNGALSLRHN